MLANRIIRTRLPILAGSPTRNLQVSERPGSYTRKLATPKAGHIHDSRKAIAAVAPTNNETSTLASRRLSATVEDQVVVSPTSNMMVAVAAVVNTPST